VIDPPSVPTLIPYALAAEEEAVADALTVPEFVIDPPDSSVSTLIPYAVAPAEIEEALAIAAI
jgi:hypothetical protein